MLLLSTYLICLLLLIDQGLFNLLIVSQSPGTHTYIGFLTNASQGRNLGYTRYIAKEAT